MKSLPDLLRNKKLFISAVIIFLFIVTASAIGSYLIFGKNIFNPPKSQVKITVEDQEVKFSFEIVEGDRLKVEEFSKRMSIGTDWIKGVSLQFDTQIAAKISEILPKELEIVFTNEGLEFNSKASTALKSSQITNKYELATSSGKLTLNYLSEKDFNLLIVDPAPLINYASESAQLHMSNRLEGVLPIASKIDRIEVISQGGVIKGKLKIKN